MAKTFFLTTIAIVVSSSVNSERRPFLSYSKNLQQAVPHFWKHDQEKLDRNLDKNPGQRWESVRAGPRPPPLRPDSPAPWHFRNHLADKQSTLNRVHQLKNKLIPKNIIHVQALNHPHPKPAVDLKKSLENNKRHKRGLAQADHESRDKREVIINPQIQPEMVMQPHIQPALLQEAENKYQDKIIEKRDKRQILLMIKRQPLKMVKKPRTTPNPFIRDTNIADYDIVKPDTYKPEVEIVNSMDSDSYQLREPQSLFQYLQSMIVKIGQKLSADMKPMSKTKDVNEEPLIRVKRRMSKFRRDRKQMTRKKKIGRRKKTRVRKAPIKLKKWYHSRQKIKKKGDGTYRGGRGRIPRQHKKPRHYKPPQNETSDYDYYDDDGKIKEPSGETQEGSDDAAYVSYGTGEYADTAEADAAQQELEKEYQMQLVRKRKKAEKRRLSNGTIESSEEEFLSINRYVESEESGSNTTSSQEGEDEEEYYDDEEDYEDSEEGEDSQEEKDSKEKKDSEEKEDSEDSDGSDSGGGTRREALKNKAAKQFIKKIFRKPPSNRKQAPKNVKGFRTPGLVQHQTKASGNIDYQKFKNLPQNAGKNTELGTNTNGLHNVRLTAKKLNVMSQSAFPGFRNSLQQAQSLNWMSAVKFGVPQNKQFKNLQSMPLKSIPDVDSITNPVVATKGGNSLQGLQSKKAFNTIESKSRDKNLSLTSTVKDRSENEHIFTSKTKDERKKLTSIGSESLKLIQSRARDPIVLTSIAKHMPLESDTKEVKGEKIMETKTDKMNTKLPSDNQSKLETTKTAKNNNKGTMQNREKGKMKYERKNKINRSKNQNLHLQGSKSYEGLSSVSDGNLGISVSSDELEPAPDDLGKNTHHVK